MAKQIPEEFLDVTMVSGVLDRNFSTFLVLAAEMVGVPEAKIKACRIATPTNENLDLLLDEINRRCPKGVYYGTKTGSLAWGFWQE